MKEIHYEIYAYNFLLKCLREKDYLEHMMFHNEKYYLNKLSEPFVVEVFNMLIKTLKQSYKGKSNGPK